MWRVVGVTIVIIAGLQSSSSHVVAQTTAPQKSYQGLEAIGATALDTPGVARPAEYFAVRGEHDHNLREATRAAARGGAPPRALAVPSPLAQAITAGRPLFGFLGLTHADQLFAGTGRYAGTQSSTEPPDQGLCVGAGFVVEAVNNALAVFDAGTGVRRAGPTPLNQFYNVAPEFDPATGLNGDFLTDPKCYFDAQTARWFVTTLQIDVDPVTGEFIGNSNLLLAVSATSDPSSTFNLFRINVTDDGTNGTVVHPDCPCFGDQPLLGADRNGLYITTNEFPLFGPGFNGAQIYALSKHQLVAGTATTVVHLEGGGLAEGPSYSVQPATSPRLGDMGDEEDGAGHGVAYFLSALDFTGTLDNRIAVWAMTNTETLADAVPNVDLTHVVIRSEVYGQPPPATQRSGPTPLRDVLASIGDTTEPLEMLDTNDDRMNQVVFADGLLWSGVNTIVSGGRAGIAWFAVKPTWSGRKLAGKIRKQGYVSLAGSHALFPSIGVTEDGEGVIAFSISGPDFFPSAAYTRVNAERGAADVRIAAAGAAPVDGFSGYEFFGGNGVARWGDYSAAVADGRGNVWIATEFISNAPRTLFANWATFIGRVPARSFDEKR